MIEMRFYVYRTGSNAANQPMTFEPVKVAEVEAKDAAEACQLASQRVTVYNNQYLDAEVADEVDRREAEVDDKVRLID
jgi:hypothetical protein